MKMSKAAAIWIDYHKNHSKKNTVRSYHSVLTGSVDQLYEFTSFIQIKFGNPCTIGELIR